MCFVDSFMLVAHDLYVFLLLQCRHCGKAFASHAAHDSHVRRTHAKDKAGPCAVCGKTFSNSYELKLHMASHHNTE